MLIDQTSGDINTYENLSEILLVYERDSSDILTILFSYVENYLLFKQRLRHGQALCYCFFLSLGVIYVRNHIFSFSSLIIKQKCKTLENK